MRFLSCVLAGLIAFSVTPVAAQAPLSGEALWRTIKTHLQAPDGEMYFEYLRATVVPPPPTSWTGTVVSSRPPDAPSQLVLGFGDSRTPEIRLMLIGESLKKPVAEGTRVKFSGVAASFRPDPYMLTLEIDLGDDPVGSISILP
jgi:hypothetical protein